MAERAGLRFTDSGNGRWSYDLDDNNLAAMERMVDMLPPGERQQLATYRQRVGYRQSPPPQRVGNPPTAHNPNVAHAGHAHNFADQVGTRMRIVGLVTPAGIAINGRTGTVIGYHECPSEHMIVEITDLPHHACVKVEHLQALERPDENMVDPDTTVPQHEARPTSAAALPTSPPPDLQAPPPPPR